MLFRKDFEQLSLSKMKDNDYYKIDVKLNDYFMRFE